MTRYDAIVIGSGQAGNPLSQNLADQGWSVALIEKEHLGGTCVNTGCTPTKTMVASAQVAHYARHAGQWGVHAGAVNVDLAEVVARKDRVVNQSRSGLERKVAVQKNLRLYRGSARFVAPHRIRVNQEEIEGERIFINTGARPNIPTLEGLDRIGYLTNASIMELRELPAHLLVLGGGYVGLEFGQMFRRFGCEVTIVHRDDQLLPKEDSDVAQELQKALEKEGIRILLSTKSTGVEKKDGQIILNLERNGKASTVTGSHLLIATGRRPNTDDLGLDAAGVQLNPKGFIKVNGRLETNVPGIWALGDANGGPAFTHISYNDYQIVYANLIEGKNLSTDHRHGAYAVITDPQLGRVGLTETDARAIERDETAGLMKLVVDAEADQILGATVLGTEGGEVVQSLGFVMLAGAP